MTNLSIYQVDAFTSKLFGGNPAAVVPLENWIEEAKMQAIAAENNLSETAFFVKNNNEFDLRWFTPVMEVDFCGHATLAAAHILYAELGELSEELIFNTRVGQLIVKKAGDNLYLMEFPADKLTPIIPSSELEHAIGLMALEAFKGREDILYIVETKEMLESVNPDFKALGEASNRGVLVTAPGDDHDFVSRCFFPNAGVDEDPVTGSAHTTMVPYWARKLKKNKLTARQISQRGGELECELSTDKKKVFLTGEALTYLKGTIFC